MISDSKSHFWLIYFAALGLAALGCIPTENNSLGGGGAGTDVSGTVGGQTFEVASGSAERGVGDTYVLTLADTPEFSCDATSGLPMNYLQVVIGEIEGVATYDADGRVFFNVYENGVSESEPAESGTVTIDDVDDFGGFIDGSISASGPESSVSGSFSVEICN